MNWSNYNQSLVRTGEILLGFDVINNWDTKLKEINKDKVGLVTILLSKIKDTTDSKNMEFEGEYIRSLA